MPEREPSELPIIAALDEGSAIAANMTDTITAEIEAVVGVESPSALAIGETDCTEIFVGLTQGEQALARVLQALCRTLGDLIGSASDVVGDLLAGASSGINSVLAQVEGLVSGFSDSITDAINGIIGTVTERLDSAVTSILETAETVVSSIGNFVGNMIDRLQLAISEILSGIGFAFRELIVTVERNFNALLTGATNVIKRIDTTVREVGEFLVELANATLETMAMTVAAVLEPLVGAGQSVLARLGDLVESIPGSLREAAETVGDLLGEKIGDPLSRVGGIIISQVEEFFGDMVERKRLSYGAILKPFFECFGIPEVSISKIVCAADDAAPETPAFFVAALAFMVPLLVAQAAGAALAPVGEQIAQEVSKAVRQSLIPPTDLLDGFTKGTLSEDRLREDFAQAGFSDSRMDELMAAFQSAPDPSIQIQAWLRGLIEEGDLDKALAENRMRPADVELLKQVVFFVPPAQDLIRMAVREVFSPDVRERFGQDEDFPEAFAKFAAQQGISDEWARNYWAAHWALPSPAQGFEMLHRGVIEVADLDVLLRALDVMPFWRDKLTQIAFNPLTRVDLRRMHALGLLTDKDLQTRYEAIGFSADDAALMVGFTVAFNFSEDELPEELEGLTRATVLNMFEDGLITRDDAVELIGRMGVGDDAAELYVEQRDLDVSRRNRTNLIESIISLAGGGRINLSQAEDSLAQLGLSAIEISRAVGKIIGLINNRDRLPSLAALEKMQKKGIIEDETFLESLKALGFNDTWAGREFELLTGAAQA